MSSSKTQIIFYFFLDILHCILTDQT